MKVYVIMGNDYPDTVFRKLKDAEQYVKQKKQEERIKFEQEHPKMVKGGFFSPRIYWRVYPFELQ